MADKNISEMFCTLARKKTELKIYWLKNQSETFGNEWLYLSGSWNFAAAWKAPINLNQKEKGKAHEFEDLSKGKIFIMGIRNFNTNRVSVLYCFNFMILWRQLKFIYLHLVPFLSDKLLLQDKRTPVHVGGL